MRVNDAGYWYKRKKAIYSLPDHRIPLRYFAIRKYSQVPAINNPPNTKSPSRQHLVHNFPE
jgi:hypothetical protein